MKRAILYILAMSLFFSVNAQEDLLSLAGKDSAGKEFVTGAFKSSRIINGHSMEFIGAGVLDFRILHRFGTVQMGLKDLFGLDDANMRMGFDFGINKNLTIGVGRSGFNKELDAFLKQRIIHQSLGPGSFPLSLVWVSGITAKTIDWPDPSKDHSFDHRLAYNHMLIIGRKFNSRFSLQAGPVYVHRNFVEAKDDNNSFAIGIGGRYRFTKRMAFMLDYHYLVSGVDMDAYTHPLSVGIDIETGGHVFQLHFSNSIGMNEKAFLTETSGKWGDGDIRFGFNLSRVFDLTGKKKTREEKW